MIRKYRELRLGEGAWVPKNLPKEVYEGAHL